MLSKPLAGAFSFSGINYGPLLFHCPERPESRTLFSEALGRRRVSFLFFNLLQCLVLKLLCCMMQSQHPNILKRFDLFTTTAKDKRVAVFLDYDGENTRTLHKHLQCMQTFPMRETL